MTRPIPYTYRVARRPKGGRAPWGVAVVGPDGKNSWLSSYATRAAALTVARLLAGRAGSVEMRP